MMTAKLKPAFTNIEAFDFAGAPLASKKGILPHLEFLKRNALEKRKFMELLKRHQLQAKYILPQNRMRSLDYPEKMTL